MVAKLSAIEGGKIDALKAKHGKIFQTGVDKRPFLFRKPSADEFERWQIRASDPKERTASFRELCMVCIVDPPESELDSILDQNPGYAMSVGAKILEKAGLVEADEVKEL
jgi:hypothetical protein